MNFKPLGGTLYGRGQQLFINISNCELNFRADGTPAIYQKGKILLMDNLTVFVRFLTDHALFTGFSYRTYRVKICITCDSWSQYRH